MKLEQAFSFWLDRTARIMKQFSATKAEELELGITIDQWVLLAMVHQNQNISQRELGKRTFKDKASVARISDILEKQGLITRTRRPENRREYSVSCTKKGNERVEFLLPYVEQARRIGIAGLSDEEIATMISLLKRVHENYDHALKGSE